MTLPLSVYRTPPRIPEVHFPKEPFVEVASAVTIELNQALKLLRNIASGRDRSEEVSYGVFVFLSMVIL